MIDGPFSSFGNVLAEVYFSEDPDVIPTPAKLAIGIFLMIKIMLLPGRFPVWPSMVTGTVRELNLETGRSGAVVGEITILNAPVGSANGISLSENNVTDSSNLADVMGDISIDFGTGGKEHIDAGAPIDEKVWLDCFSMLMFHAFPHVHTELVARTFSAGILVYRRPQHEIHVFNYGDCGVWADMGRRGSVATLHIAWEGQDECLEKYGGWRNAHPRPTSRKITIVAIKTVARDNSTNSVATA